MTFAKLLVDLVEGTAARALFFAESVLMVGVFLCWLGKVTRGVNLQHPLAVHGACLASVPHLW